MLQQIMQLSSKMAKKFEVIAFLGPLAIRLYLVPIFFMAGYMKYSHFNDTVAWFGNTEWGLGLPYPELMAYLATATELMGALFLLIGFFTRWITIPLMFTMVIAITTVHWDHGWLAISSNSSEAAMRLSNFLEWLQQTYPMRYEYITELGQPVILNNGIEFAATYMIMLLSLFFTGAGKYMSVDYWLLRMCHKCNSTV